MQGNYFGILIVANLRFGNILQVFFIVALGIMLDKADAELDVRQAIQKIP